jgi:hypothetical protein
VAGSGHALAAVEVERDAGDEAASSLAKKATAAATSSTSAWRRSGISCSTRSRSSGVRRSAHRPRVRSVITTPGQMQLTVMPCGPNSCAIWRVSAAMAPLAAA